jgi:hypothetical protein
MHQASVIGSSMGLHTSVSRYSHTVPPSSHERSTSPTKDDHIEIWATSLNLANTKDNWYRATQGVYVFSKTNNTTRHVGDEIDFAWTHMFMDGKLPLQAVYGHLFAGADIKENLGTNADQDWTYLQLWMNF